MATGKGLVRSLSRRGTRSNKTRPEEGSTKRRREPAVCERCGAIYARRTWRRGRALTHAALGRARWVVCPACRQTDDQQYVGRLLLQGSYVAAHEPAVRARIEHVVGRAQARQPERRLVSLERQRDGLEVLTTSQKLAHRVAHELRKAFGGRTTYAWSDDGSLLATWQRD